MIRLRHKLLIYGLRILDQGIVVLLLFLVMEGGSVDYSLTMARFYRALAFSYPLADIIGILLIGVSSLIFFSKLVGYESNRYLSLIVQIKRLVKACSGLSFAVIVIAVLFDFQSLSPQAVVVFWATSLIISVLTRVALYTLLATFRKSGQNQRHLLVVGINNDSISLAKRILNSPELGYKIVGFVDDEDKQDSNLLLKAGDSETYKYVGSLQQLPHILEHGTIDEVLIGLPLRRRIYDIILATRMCRDIGVVTRVIPDPKYASLFRSSQVERYEGDYIITFFRENLLMQLLLKRLMDIGISLTMIALISPLLLTVAIGVKLTSKGPVFFAQERVGMNKRRFNLLKFRSMVIDAEKIKQSLQHLNEVDGPVFKIKNDPRVTKIGRFIRKTSIDELPQLINVLKGEMSLVGPRPPLESEVEKYDWLFRKRLAIKPGITCLWQVMGRNNLSFEEWMKLDKDYVNNWSILLDLKILLMTVPVVLTGKGAS